MAVFGDNSTVGIFQRAGTIPGGLRVETGCWTEGTDTSVAVPTQFVEVYSFVGDGTQAATEAYEVSIGSSGNRIVAQQTENTTGKFINYVALGM